MKHSRQALGLVADLQLGKMLDEKKNKGIPRPYLANVNVRWGSFDLENLREMRFEDDELEQFGLRCGDIVMCEGGEPGRCAIWKEGAEGMMFQKALHRIRASESLDQCFLFYRLFFMGMSGEFAPLFTGSTIKHLPRQNLAKVEIEFPELSKQRRIASILTAYDNLIENNRRRMTLLEDAARKLYHEWFIRLRFPGHEHAPIHNGLPEGWKLSPLEEVAEFRLGKMLDEKKNKGDLRPYLANVNLRWGEFELSNLREMRFQDNEVESYGLKSGDIVMCEGGEPGRCAIWMRQ